MTARPLLPALCIGLVALILLGWAPDHQAAADKDRGRACGPEGTWVFGSFGTETIIRSGNRIEFQVGVSGLNDDYSLGGQFPGAVMPNGSIRGSGVG